MNSFIVFVVEHINEKISSLSHHEDIFKDIVLRKSDLDFSFL